MTGRGAKKNLESLEEAVAEHNAEVLELFPFLANEVILDGNVALGSNYSLTGKDDPDFRGFCDKELELRVGLGHELVQDMRTTASLVYRLYGLQLSQTKGVKEMKQTAEAQKRASNSRNRLASDYKHNWRKIQELLDCDWVEPDDGRKRLRGLRQLSMEDIWYFANPGEQTNAYMAYSNSEASWIWKVQMLGTAASTDPGRMDEALIAWEHECLYSHL